MSILDRFLLILLSIIGIVAGIVLVLLGTSVLGTWSVTPLGDFSAYPNNVIAIIVGVLVMLIALRFLFFRLRRMEAESVVLSGEHGNIQISYETIRALANRIGKTTRGVQDLQTRVRSGDRGIMLAVRVRVLPDVEMPQMSSDIQTNVKDYLERITGIEVEQVLVSVVELAATNQKAAKAWVE